MATLRSIAMGVPVLESDSSGIVYEQYHYRIRSAGTSDTPAIDSPNPNWLYDRAGGGGNQYLTQAGSVSGNAVSVSFDSSVPAYAQLSGLAAHERFGTFTYTFPVDNSQNVRVRVYLCETFFGVEANPGGEGSRVFSIRVNGIIPANMQDIDIFAAVGPATMMMLQTDTTANENGDCVIQTVAGTNNPSIVAIEVFAPTGKIA